MNILLTNISLAKPGGSETFTYTMVKELIRRGHNVYVFTFRKGLVYDKIINELKANVMLDMKYDLILANHTSCIDHVYGMGPIIQTCHGYIPPPEQPNPKADFHVGISQEVVDHLSNKNFKSNLIHNGIDCERFNKTKSVNENLTNVLSLVQNDETNNRLSEICNSLGINFFSFNKKSNFVWDVENKINEADLVISLGRGAYESFACARQVLVYDTRSYFKPFGDGLTTSSNIQELIKNNCSGRRYKKTYTDDDIICELKAYNSSEGDKMREFALKELNISNQVDKYFEIVNKNFYR
jgi:glycosyltransferase involved in cell wall biosynthesis